MSIDSTGRLVVVGTGIRTTGQLTIEAIAWMKIADVLFHSVSDPVAQALVREYHPTTNVDLSVFYEEGRHRRRTYQAMADAIVAEVQAAKTVCAVFYGHPGVFARPPQLAIERTRALGYPAEMLPAVSAEDCLFADLGVDPGDGCLSYEATNFLLNDHRADPSVHLVLWQIGVLGDWTHRARRGKSSNMDLMVEKLAAWYPADHQVVVYQASVRLDRPARADRVPLSGLPSVDLGSGCTLYVPPSQSLKPDPIFAERVVRIQ